MKLHAIAETIQRALTAAGLAPRSRLVKRVDTTIRDALRAAGLVQRPIGDSPNAAPSNPSAAAVTIDADDASSAGLVAEQIAVQRAARIAPGDFVDREFANAAGARRYKLFVPASAAREPMPLIVMLHGCKQNPDDFAAGTRMNELAQAHGFLVAYPAQSVGANGSNCWNWFQPRDQAREAGEAAIIAGIALQIAEDHAVDRQRIFVAGLSAGAAMAVILGATYPEVFAAVGAHSGLPYQAAHDVVSAFGAMSAHGAVWGGSMARAAAQAAPDRVGVPTIVFHGDRDTTVAARNGWAIVDQARSAFTAHDTPLHMSVEEGTSSTGDAFTLSRFSDDHGHARVEHWLLHGGAHAWSGGSTRGSYTAENGPDASAEMLRFFLAQ